jgi:hypothetical protein
MQMLDTRLEQIAADPRVVEGALLAVGGAFSWLPETYDAEPESPGTRRSPRGNPARDEQDVSRGVEQLHRICGH